MLIEFSRSIPNTAIPMPIRDEHGEITKYANYYFVPVDPDNPESPHVSEVPYKDHIKRFLSLDDYAQYEGPAPETLVEPVVMMRAIFADAAGKTRPHPKRTPYAPAKLERTTTTGTLTSASAFEVSSTFEAPSLLPTGPAPVGTLTNVKAEPEPPALSDVIDEIRKLKGSDLRHWLSSPACKWTSYQVQAAIDSELQRTDAPPRNSWLEIAKYGLQGLKDAGK